MVVLKEYNMIHDKNTIKNIHMIGCDIIGLEHRNTVKLMNQIWHNDIL